jgi:hypothetical protein
MALYLKAMKNLTLHIGAGKTGTSAIQTALARMQSELWDEGIYYPHHPSFVKATNGLATSGNAGTLALYLKNKLPKESQETSINEWLLNTITASKDRNILVSSEALSNVNSANLEKFSDLLIKNNVKPNIIYYVRHVADLLTSGYGQFAKNGLFKHSLHKALKKAVAPYKSQLELYSKVFGAESIQVYLYDEEKNNLLKYFLAHIGICRDDITVEVVNPSISRKGLEIIRLLVEMELGGELLKTVIEYIQHKEGAKNMPFPLTEKELNCVSDLNLDVINYVNKNFFDGFPRLKIKSDKITIVDESVFEPSENEIILLNTIDALLKANKSLILENNAYEAKKSTPLNF